MTIFVQNYFHFIPLAKTPLADYSQATPNSL